MATYSPPANPKAVSSRSFVQKASELYGVEGKALTQKLTQVDKELIQDEPIQRLLKSLERTTEKRHEGLQRYLDSLRLEARVSGESEFTVSVIDTAWQVWERLKKHFLDQGVCLEVPDACPGQRDNFMYTWSRCEHYFECEIFGNGQIEFFYRNRNTGALWGEDTTLEKGFSTDIFGKASIFTW